MTLALMEEKKPGLFQKILKQDPRENAVIRVNNLLAQAHDVRSVTTQHVAEACGGVAPTDGDFLALYSRYVDYCLTDGRLSADDQECLAHVRRLLGIKDTDANEAQERAAGVVYRRFVQAALGDGVLDSNDAATLAQVQIDLNLSEGTANIIYSECARTVYQILFNRVVSGGKYSPQQEEELRGVAANLRVAINYDGNTTAVLARLRFLWEIEEGRPPEIPVSINLQQGETCHAHVRTDLHEVRRVTQGISYAGVSTSTKLFKGVRVHGGSYAIHRRSKDVLTRLDSGDLYVTNKRVIFMGRQKNLTVKTSAILSVTQYSDGVEVEKGSGKNHFFLFSHDVVAFVKILQRVISEA